MSKRTWSKKEGLDLRWDKNKILKKELKEKGRKSKEVPKVQGSQVHKGQENYCRKKSGDDGGERDLIDHGEFKERIMRKISHLRGIADLEARCKKMRKIEGMVHHVLINKGSFTEQQADRIVDAFMVSREINDSLHHPLQTTVVQSTRYKSRASMFNTSIFSDAMMRMALNKRGFYLNLGLFSAAETLTLMKNFEEFLARHGHATDRDSIWKTLTDEFHSFYRRTRMFLHIGKGLNRSSSQMKARLFALYHPWANGKSDAKTDAHILSRVPELESVGVHRKHKQIGEEVHRFRRFVSHRYQYLTDDTSFTAKVLRKDILKLIAEQQKCTISKIIASDIDFAVIATKLATDEDVLRSFWKKEGARICARASLPKWKLEDSLLLLKSIEDEGEEDENCIDFKGIYDRLFRGKVQNWEHLREHYNRVRRVVPYYMLNDLQSTVAAAIKAIKEKMEKGAGGGLQEVDTEMEGGELEEDEDNFIE